jgi:hypothetical protein
MRSDLSMEEMMTQIPTEIGWLGSVFMMFIFLLLFLKFVGGLFLTHRFSHWVVDTRFLKSSTAKGIVLERIHHPAQMGSMTLYEQNPFRLEKRHYFEERWQLRLRALGVEQKVDVSQQVFDGVAVGEVVQVRYALSRVKKTLLIKKVLLDTKRGMH